MQFWIKKNHHFQKLNAVNMNTSPDSNSISAVYKTNTLTTELWWAMMIYNQNDLYKQS